MKKTLAVVLVALLGTAVSAGLVHALLVASHLSEPASTAVNGMTPRRLWATSAAALSLVGLAIGGFALARPSRLTGIEPGPRRANLAVAAGLIAAVNGGLNLVVANGGPGSGNGVVGGAVAGVVGFI